ncbi:hypothetical protein BGZ61DRAFT_375946 [Ilyonectria robusta]|uniref:uncharacterized protein n=1 Tax=Ilyonectria robusta TaxID=1079257 RepID=UPI001E8DA5A7|nr:uncharacterized protein BGZ61DRAFT_375946 [Ilyonectria robusta]KAH8649766.1 hypothetical protein BGZ61DRAFT_375946 [Ilyonectria robusta]
MRLPSSVATLAAFCQLAAAIPSSGNSSDYEYIVVGSGAGGGTVAATLARKGHSVFLIEAGGDHGDDLIQEMPSRASTAIENSAMAWQFYINNYRNQTQGRRDSKYTYRLSDGTLYYGLDPPAGAEPLGTLYPRGATVGGSTQVNALNWAAASDKDWDLIAEYTGDDSWSAEAMKPYFVALENRTYREEVAPALGFDGFISTNRNNVTYITGRPDLAEFMSNAIRHTEGVNVSGIDHLTEFLQRDVNDPMYSYTPGAYQLSVAMTEDRRRSAARNYIVDTIAAGYPLTLSTHSLASHILFDRSSSVPRAVGVEYMVGEALYGADPRFNVSQTGQVKTVSASKEVIVSGGVFNTPQLLKLSGVGPREELESFGIDVIVDSPSVGKYLQDHTEAIVVVNATEPWSNDPNANCTRQFDSTDPCFLEWQNSGTGPYGEGAAPLSIRHRSSQSEDEEIDIWIYGFTGAIVRGWYPGFSQASPAPSSLSFAIIKTQTPGDEATGTVTLRSANPRDTPEIVVDWLQGEHGERDLEILTEGAQLLYSIMEDSSSPPAPYSRVQPGEGVDVAQNLKDEAFGHHGGCTCRMGPANSLDHCVDSELRVNGVHGLRIVDMSVFPRVPGAFPQQSTYIMALKAADIISQSGV